MIAHNEIMAFVVLMAIILAASFAIPPPTSSSPLWAFVLAKGPCLLARVPRFSLKVDSVFKDSECEIMAFVVPMAVIVLAPSSMSWHGSQEIMAKVDFCF